MPGAGHPYGRGYGTGNVRSRPRTKRSIITKRGPRSATPVKLTQFLPGKSAPAPPPGPPPKVPQAGATTPFDSNAVACAALAEAGDREGELAQTYDTYAQDSVYFTPPERQRFAGFAVDATDHQRAHGLAMQVRGCPPP